MTEENKECLKIVRDFYKDVLTVFPEYKDKIEGSLRRVCCNEGDDDDKEEVFNYVGEILPERFFDILYQNADIFDDDEINTCFLPNIEFSHLWKCEGKR